MNSHQKMTAARTDLVLLDPFFGSLALGLTLKSDPGCGTAYTDGRVLGYDPAFIEPMPHGTIKALIAHEVMHCAMGHPWRRDGRDPHEWNVAADKAINGTLKESYTLPSDWLFPAPGEEGKSAEWYYARKQEQPPQDDPQGQGDPNGEGEQDGTAGPSDTPGEVRDAPTEADESGEPAPTEADWKQKTAEAVNAAKMAGKLSGGIARMVQAALSPRLDIRALLLRFFSERAAADYSWTRPNSRYLSSGLYLPALESRSMGEVAIMVDTSGSVDETSLGYARGIVESVIQECNPAAVTVYYADAEVKRVDRFEQGDPLEWQPMGGGGTDFTPAMEAIDAAGEAVCIVCISDLEGTFPDTPPAMPVIWLSTEAGNVAPFGETVPIDR